MNLALSSYMLNSIETRLIIVLLKTCSAVPYNSHMLTYLKQKYSWCLCKHTNQKQKIHNHKDTHVSNQSDDGNSKTFSFFYFLSWASHVSLNYVADFGNTFCQRMDSIAEICRDPAGQPFYIWSPECWGSRHLSSFSAEKQNKSP